jgi:hypothetical protein
MRRIGGQRIKTFYKEQVSGAKWLKTSEYCMIALVAYYLCMLIVSGLLIGYAASLAVVRDLNLLDLAVCTGTDTDNCLTALPEPPKIDVGGSDKYVACSGADKKSFHEAVFTQTRGQQVTVGFSAGLALLLVAMNAFKYLKHYRDADASEGDWTAWSHWKKLDIVSKVIEFFFLAFLSAAWTNVILSRPQTDGSSSLGTEAAFQLAGCQYYASTAAATAAAAGTGAAVDNYTSVVGDGFGIVTAAAVFYIVAFGLTRVYDPRRPPGKSCQDGLQAFRA